MGRALWLVLLVLLPGALLPAAGADAPVERRLVAFDGAAPLEGSWLPGGARVLDAFPFARLALVEGAPDALNALAAHAGIAGVYRDELLAPALDRTRAIVNAEPREGDASWPTGRGVTIAMVDSGLDASHPGFEGRVAAAIRISRSGFVSNGGTDVDGHGTHVAGILAGSGARSEDARLRGFAPEASLVGIDISDSFTTTSAVRAFEWIHDHREEHGIRVVSNSWGREKDDSHYDADDPVIRASDALVADGVVVVFSAGNRGRDGAGTVTTEGSNPNVLTVGAATASGRVESYSSRGPARDAQGAPLSWTKPDVVAPGSAILSTRAVSQQPPSAASDEERHYWLMNGTSMAAPQVAGAAALVLEARPELTPALVSAILQQTARDVAVPGPDVDTGFGMLDVRAAIDAARTLGRADRRIVIESVLPIRHDGSVAAAEGLVLLAGGAPQLPPAAAIEIPFVLPEHAARLDLHFNWSGPGRFDARLEGPGGSWAFEPVAGASLRLARDAIPGSYRLVATPSAAAYTPYSLQGYAMLREERVVDEPAEFHARPTTASGGFFTGGGAGGALDVLAEKPIMVLTCFIAASSLGAAWAMRRR